MNLPRMLEIVFCLLACEVVRKPDVRIGCSVVLTTDCPSIVVSSLLVIVEAFLREALRFFDVAKAVIEPPSAIRELVAVKVLRRVSPT